MALEVLQAIHLAEQKAEEITGEAQKSAREMIDLAQKSSSERLRDSERVNRETFNSLIAQRRRAIEVALIKESETEKAARLLQLEEACKLLPQAAQMIMNKVLTDAHR
jgi:vacuolar-type H+-ATPase subunit H